MKEQWNHHYRHYKTNMKNKTTDPIKSQLHCTMHLRMMLMKHY